jgi:hypothetical protein
MSGLITSTRIQHEMVHVPGPSLPPNADHRSVAQLTHHRVLTKLANYALIPDLAAQIEPPAGGTPSWTIYQSEAPHRR